MSKPQRFNYVEIDPSLGATSALPYAPITLELDGNVANVPALVDSGAALSVLPCHVGVQLGAVWERQTIPVQLAGNLAESDARVSSGKVIHRRRVTAAVRPALTVAVHVASGSSG